MPLRKMLLLAAYFAIAATEARAGAKDESAAGWIAPKLLNEWHDALLAKGLNFGATYIGDFIGNASGGTSRGAIHLGRFEFSVDADLEKLVGWTGGRFFANTFEIYGRGLTRNYIHNLATVSETEALPDARLYTAYFEQNFYNNALNIRIGQQAADVEFFDSETDDLFVNGTFGWPAITATNLPAGGPAPPIAALGVRVKRRCRTGSRRSRPFSTATRRSREKATHNFATITAWRFASTMLRGLSGRFAGITMSKSPDAPWPATLRQEAGIISANSTIST
jgi:porin